MNTGDDARAPVLAPENDGQSGIALVAVLWTILLLSVLAATLVAISRSDARIAKGEIARLQADDAAKVGINLAVAALTDPNGNWPLDGSVRTLTFGDATIEVSIASESGKVDVNTADPALITGLLMVAGASPGDAANMTAAIEAQRSGNGGSEPARPFLSLGELMALPGMSRDLYDRLRPSLTLYSGSVSVDADVAGINVLLAVPGSTRADAEATLAVRASPDQRAAAGGDLSHVIDHAFTIDAVAMMRDGALARKGAILRMTGDPRRPAWGLGED